MISGIAWRFLYEPKHVSGVWVFRIRKSLWEHSTFESRYWQPGQRILETQHFALCHVLLVPCHTRHGQLPAAVKAHTVHSKRVGCIYRRAGQTTFALEGPLWETTHDIRVSLCYPHVRRAGSGGCGTLSAAAGVNARWRRGARAALAKVPLSAMNIPTRYMGRQWC